MKGNQRPRAGVLLTRLVSIPLALVASGLALAYFLSPPEAVERSVTIEPGLSLGAVAERLEEGGVIRSALALRIWARLAGGDREIKAGIYRFSPGESLPRVLARLRAGVPSSVRITIPEGLPSRAVAGIVASELSFEAADYVRSVRDSSLASLLGVPSENLEGYLFPETYDVSPAAEPEDLVRLQVSTFRSVFGPRWVRRAEELGFTAHEIVILASIVEREARVDDERPRISAVFHNRLARGMKLQADPTVRFALDEWRRPLTHRDLAVDSPYNTYLVAGLPPGPICNPGRASLEAALYPLPDSRELYFVARGDGTHLFSTTSREHERARREARQVSR